MYQKVNKQDGENLGTWLKTQRASKKRGTLSIESTRVYITSIGEDGCSIWDERCVSCVPVDYGILVASSYVRTCRNTNGLCTIDDIV
jgi:hypothetical protein